MLYCIMQKSEEPERFPALFGLSSTPGIGTASRRVGVRAGGYFNLAYRMAAERRVMCGMAKGHENLIPLNKRSKDEQRKIQRMGGIANGEQRRKKSTVKSILNEWANKPISNAKLKQQAESYGIDTDEGRTLITLALINNAMKGNSKYMDMVLRLMGEDSAPDDTANDGFVDAFKSSAADDWGGSDV